MQTDCPLRTLSFAIQFLPSNYSRQLPKITTMSVSQAAYQAEKAIGHDGSTITQQDVTNYEGAGDKENTMKALVWQGKNKVQIVETARPKILEPRDVILKVTGTTLCGSDLHLLHGKVSPIPAEFRELHSHTHSRFCRPDGQW